LVERDAMPLAERKKVSGLPPSARISSSRGRPVFLIAMEVLGADELTAVSAICLRWLLALSCRNIVLVIGSIWDKLR